MVLFQPRQEERRSRGTQSKEEGKVIRGSIVVSSWKVKVILALY